MQKPSTLVQLSGNALASINVVALRQTRLVLGWVTVRVVQKIFFLNLTLHCW